MNIRQRMGHLASVARAKAASLTTSVATTLGIVGTAQAQTAPTDALAAVTTLSTSATGFGPVMWGLAVTVVGILIGVKWIKRAKGAA